MGGGDVRERGAGRREVVGGSDGSQEREGGRERGE